MASHPIIEYLVRPDRTVLEIHGEWDRFAAANQAPDLRVERVLGRSLDEFVSGSETRLIYQALIERILETGEPIRFEYRCDGPDRRRYMTMRLELAAPGIVRFRSRLVRDEPREPQGLIDTTRARSDEIVAICSWCKRIRAGADDWLDIEDYVRQSRVMEREELPRLTHGVCPSCESHMDGLTGAA